MKINICTDFTESPGARYISEGEYSGEEFRDKILEPNFKIAKEKNEKIIIELDGGYGYATSFLEEASGGLARKHSPKDVLEMLEFVSYDEPSLIEEIKNYIIHANEKKKRKH